MDELSACRVGVLGLGYVGLPLAVEFGRKYPTVGFDLKASRVAELNAGLDSTLEVTRQELRSASQLVVSNRPEDMSSCNVYVVTVPTPIDRYKRPDLSALVNASQTVGRLLAPGNTVIFESTVYPGATEEVCVPILERESGLVLNEGFFAGYSPERINPGDRVRRLPDILKVTSGSNSHAAAFIDALYASIIPAGTYRASSIRVAEAAKVIENTQRDVNIGLINELAMIFNRLGIDTEEVLAAAGTKWNFLPFRPGLVGGHCIGVDPYYLTHKAQEVGFHPAMILAGRRTNDNMGIYVAAQVVKLMVLRSIDVARSRVLVMGLSFKENCPDARNTRVIDLVRELATYNAEVEVHDPWVDHDVALEEYGLRLVERPTSGAYDAVVIAVAHRQFVDMGAAKLRQFCSANGVLYDIKHTLKASEVDGRL